MDKTINFISWNTNGLNHPVKRKMIFTVFHRLYANINFVQETHVRREDSQCFFRFWRDPQFHSNSSAKIRGVSIFIDSSTPFTHHETISDPHGRFLLVTGLLCNQKVVLVNVYAPNYDCPEFFKGLFTSFPNLNEYLLVMGGDFNCCLNPSMDRSKPTQVLPNKSASLINSFMVDSGISEIWRFIHPKDKEFSYFSHVYRSYSRIDYFLINHRLLMDVVDCNYDSITISDHAPLKLTIKMSDSFSTTRSWRLSVTLLQDPEFITFIKHQIDLFFSTNFTEEIDNGILWDSFKAYTRGQIISYSAGIRKQMYSQIAILVDKLKEIDKSYAVTPTKELYKKRVELQMEHSLLLSSFIEKQLIKSRTQFYIHSDRSGKLLASQLKANSVKRQIIKIRKQDGNLTVDHKEINKTFYDFYNSLYQSEFMGDFSLMNKFFSNLNIPKLSTVDQALFDAPISETEIGEAISSMNSGKAPGPDGYTAEFLKMFSSLLSPWLCKIFNDAFIKGKLPQSFYDASISLILKKDKDPTECASYRPISLLNTDSKILTKILATRLENVLPQIISQDQTGFIKNRYSFFNIRKLINIIYTSSPQTPECVISLDAEKAFDRIEWPYLFNTLKSFNFSSKFISWIKLVYYKPQASVLTNNYRSPAFQLFRGTRQGCPLSPLLFNIALEPLAIAIRQSPNIFGIIREEKLYKLSLYADDLLLYISDLDRSIPAILSLLDQFGSFSGYKLNFNKSELFPLNAQTLTSRSIPFKVVTDNFTYLGIKITKKHKDLFRMNFLPLISQIKQLTNRWSPLSLSLIGRINAIKMILLPKFLYLFQALPVFIPKSFFDTVDSKISSYVWQNKNPRLSRKFLQKSKKEGGLALPNLRFYYWATNIRNLIHWKQELDMPSCPQWVDMECKAVRGYSLYSILGSSLPFDLAKLNKQIYNPIVKYTLRIWFQFRKFFTLNNFVLSSPIIFNFFFQPSLIDQAFKIWKRNGITCFRDLFLDGSFMSFEELSNKFK